MRGTDEQAERNIPLFDFVYRLGFDRGFLHLLSDFMITVAIPVITNSSKSISCFLELRSVGFRLLSRSTFGVLFSHRLFYPRPMTHSI